MKRILQVVSLTLVCIGIVGISYSPFAKKVRLVTKDIRHSLSTSQKATAHIDADGNVLYTGQIYHIFFHSLIIYPKLAFTNTRSSTIYKDYMITRDEFQKILPELYARNFILLSIKSLYYSDSKGTLHQKPLYIPPGKKPLIISLDDTSYYSFMSGHGFAKKLVLDDHGKVATEVVTPGGETITTRDGDVIPILDDFVSSHPDFSFHGAKGIIAVTGFEGILGYRTNAMHSSGSELDNTSVKQIVSTLKSTGWVFASHSYSHAKGFSTGSMSLDFVKEDTKKWKKEVEPLVGPTDIFVGPFGQIFPTNDPRREYLTSQGFKVFCGVGMDTYLHYFPTTMVMDRADIDGYRLTKTPHYLTPYFNPSTVIDPAR